MRSDGATRTSNCLQTYADATQCGDGTIYRAAGFDLVGIRRNSQVWRGPNGATVRLLTVTKGRYALENRGSSSMTPYRGASYVPLVGFQLRYVRCLRPGVRERLTVATNPYSEIGRRDAGMYLGRRKESSEPPAYPGRRGRGSTDPDAPI